MHVVPLHEAPGGARRIAMLPERDDPDPVGWCVVQDVAIDGEIHRLLLTRDATRR